MDYDTYEVDDYISELIEDRVHEMLSDNLLLLEVMLRSGIEVEDEVLTTLRTIALEEIKREADSACHEYKTRNQSDYLQ